MSKVDLTDVASLTNEQTALSTMSVNNGLIETAFDNTLSRDGTTPNQMEADLDMNSNRILNLPAPGSQNEPLRLADLSTVTLTALSLPGSSTDKSLVTWNGAGAGGLLDSVRITAIGSNLLFYDTNLKQKLSLETGTHGFIEVGDLQGVESVGVSQPYMDWHFSVGSLQDFNFRMQNIGNGLMQFTGLSAITCEFYDNGGIAGANHLRIISGTAGNAPVIQAIGTDSNVGIILNNKGVGGLYVTSTAANDSFVAVVGLKDYARLYLDATGGTGGRNWSISSYSGALSHGVFAIADENAAAARLLIDTSGVVSIPAGVASTTPSTGALVVTAGAGIGGALYVQGLVAAGGVISNINMNANFPPIGGQSYTGWNFSSGSGEIAFFNCYTTATTSFQWRQLTGASASTQLMTLGPTGALALNAGVTATTYSATGAVTAYSGTAIPANGTTGSGIKFSSTANFGMFFGSGAPTLAAAQGSLYVRSDGSSVSTRLYVNTNGASSWTTLTAAA